MGTYSQWEISVNLFFQSLGAWLQPFMSTVTTLGSEPFYILLITAIYWCINTAAGLRVGLTLMLSSSSNFIFKLLFHTPRPYWVDGQVKALSAETSFGLPSGHSQNAVSFWGVLAATIKQKTGWVAGIIILLMGISRIYLGVHFLRDVLLGWLIGSLLLILVIMYEAPIVTWFKRQHLIYRLAFSLMTALGLIALALVVRATEAGWTLPPAWYQAALRAAPETPINPLSFNGIFTSSGTWLGIMVGASLLVGGIGGHSVAGPVGIRLLRWPVGAAGLALLYFGLGAIFPRTDDVLGYLFRFLRYSLIGFWVVWLAPWVFIKIGLSRPCEKV